MKSIAIVTGSELRQVQGVNYFIKSFIECNKFFKSCAVTRIYSSKQVLDIEKGDTMPIGSDIGSTEYKVRTGIRSFLRKLLSSRFYPFALFRFQLNYWHNSSKSIANLTKEREKHDCIIFQEIGCAEYYFKRLKNGNENAKTKTALVIHTEDDSGSMLINQFSGLGRKDMTRRYLSRRNYVYNRIDKVVYISRKAYENSILPDCKKAFVYNGVPNIEYSFNTKLQELTRFVCVGSFTGRKGQELIVEALSLMDSDHLNKLHVTFVGDGAELENVKSLSIKHSLSKHVSFMGRCNNVPEILKGQDVFIMPSTVEGLPMSAIEAMRAGLFLILTDTGGNQELCNNNCGFICTREPLSILSRMYDVMDDGVVSMEQKRNSHQRFLNEFSLEEMASGYESILTSML